MKSSALKVGEWSGRVGEWASGGGIHSASGRVASSVACSDASSAAGSLAKPTPRASQLGHAPGLPVLQWNMQSKVR